jgi:HD superfamily phosphohydrolase
MYHSVYFHKTTRGVQHLVRDMLVEIILKHHDKPQLKDLPLIKFFKQDQGLARYQSLDDSSVLSEHNSTCS